MWVMMNISFWDMGGGRVTWPWHTAFSDIL